MVHWPERRRSSWRSSRRRRSGTADANEAEVDEGAGGEDGVGAEEVEDVGAEVGVEVVGAGAEAEVLTAE